MVTRYKQKFQHPDWQVFAANFNVPNLNFLGTSITDRVYSKTTAIKI